MTRLLVCVLLFTVAFAACSFNKTSTSNTNQTAQSNEQPSPAKPTATTSSAPVQADGLQPGQASGSYTAKGEKVELKPKVKSP